MKLTRKKAISLCIELWTWLAETGKYKWEWPRWVEFDSIASNCWFCEYDNRQKKSKGGDDCKYCPLVKQLGMLHCSKSYYRLWLRAKTPRTRKKYAKLFLEQIESIEQRT